MHKPKYIVIDIGTHKFEELKVLFLPGKAELVKLLYWSLKQLIKAITKLEFASLTPVLETIRMFIRPRNYEAIKDIKFICIEPNIDICQPELKIFKQKLDVDYYPIAILGHSHIDEVNIVSLNCYANSLSSSIYAKKNLSITRKLSCLGLKFSAFLELLKKKLIVLPQDLIILRINCEGAELGIVRAIQNSGLHVHAICGSLADVRKIHGEVEYKEMLAILSDLGVDYNYFVGSNPFTWREVFTAPSLSNLIFRP